MVIEITDRPSGFWEAYKQGRTMQTINFSAMSADELNSIIKAAQAALKNLNASPTAMLRIAIQFDAYNWRRYSKPWIGKVTSWPVGARSEIQFGHYLGGPGGGEAEIQAKPGDIVRWGQKDSRGNGSTAHWGVVGEDGSVSKCTEAEARAAYKTI